MIQNRIMPIRPEHRWLYPIDWRELSDLVRFTRAKGCCEHCDRPHGKTVLHLGDGRWWDAERRWWRDGKGRRVRAPGGNILALVRSTRVWLACAHLNHDPIDYCLHLGKRVRDEAIVLASGDKEVLRIALAMTHMVGISGHSMLKLTEDVSLLVRDTYPIARAIVEGTINTVLILAGGSETAARAARHAEAKAFRDLERDWNVGGFKMKAGFSGELAPEDKTRLEALLPEFTTARGYERDWIDENLKQRLSIISETFPKRIGLALNTAAFNVYRHASEVVHGSYFSALHFWGLTSPTGQQPHSTDELRLVLLDHQFSVLMSAIWSYSALVDGIGVYVGDATLSSAAAEPLDLLQRLPAVADAPGEPLPFTIQN